MIGSLVWIGLLGRREQLAHPGDVMRAGAAGQQAVVANAVEAARQHVNEEAANELGDRKRHRLLPIATFDPVILPFERDGAVSERDQPAVGDGDAMGVARQVGQNGRGPAERSLGIDNPFGLAERREKRRECVARREIGVASNELQLAGVEGGQEFFEEETAEQPRENAHVQKEAGPAGDPAQTVQREAAPRRDHVNMGMMGQRRTPGMQNRYNADAGAQVLGIGGDRHQRFGRRLEKKVINRCLIVIGDIGDGGRQREHEVIIGNRQQFGFPLGEPRSGRRALTPRAMSVAARIVRDVLVSAVLAARDMTAERAVRQFSIADITFNWLRLTWPALASRQAWPWPRKMSATSRARRATRSGRQAGASGSAGLLVGILARFKPSRSSGLVTSRIVLTATRV